MQIVQNRRRFLTGLSAASAAGTSELMSSAELRLSVAGAASGRRNTPCDPRIRGDHSSKAAGYSFLSKLEGADVQQISIELHNPTSTAVCSRRCPQTSSCSGCWIFRTCQSKGRRSCPIEFARMRASGEDWA